MLFSAAVGFPETIADGYFHSVELDVNCVKTIEFAGRPNPKDPIKGARKNKRNRRCLDGQLRGPKRRRRVELEWRDYAREDAWIN